MFNSIKNILLIIFVPILILIGLILIIFIFSFVIHYIYFRCVKKIKPNRPNIDYKPRKFPGFFKKIFILFPKQLILDILHSNPFDFKEYGLHMVCGAQGSGKTMTVVYLLQQWKNKYPMMKIGTNMFYTLQDFPIEHWKDLIDHKNGSFGIANVIDEIQTWFNSLESKDFPIEMIEQVSQQRKQRKCIVGTAQVFSRIAKPIREQTHFVYIPITLFGCLTIVRKTKPEYWDDEKQKFKKYTGTFFFVQNKELRESYDTYRIIEKYKNEGFNINQQLLNASSTPSQTFSFQLNTKNK